MPHSIQNVQKPRRVKGKMPRKMRRVEDCLAGILLKKMAIFCANLRGANKSIRGFEEMCSIPDINFGGHSFGQH